MKNKFVLWESLPRAIAAIKQNPEIKLVMTNGCFDILHPGHVYSLIYARSQGNMLIVLVNDDNSVTHLKGVGKPINPLSDRIYLLGALESVDIVTPLPEIHVMEALEIIKPHIWVKGGDYTLETLNQGERQIAERNNTKIVFCPTLQGFSTTKTISQIQANQELLVNQVLNPPKTDATSVDMKTGVINQMPRSMPTQQCKHLSTRTIKKPGCGCLKKVFNCTIKNRDLMSLGECNGCSSKDSNSPTQ